MPISLTQICQMSNILLNLTRKDSCYAKNVDFNVIKTRGRRKKEIVLSQIYRSIS